MKRNLVRRTGFTLVELLVGILILLLLLIAVSTAVFSSTPTRRLREASSNMQSLFANARSRAATRNEPVGIELLPMDNNRELVRTVRLVRQGPAISLGSARVVEGDAVNRPGVFDRVMLIGADARQFQKLNIVTLTTTSNPPSPTGATGDFFVGSIRFGKAGPIYSFLANNDSLNGTIATTLYERNNLAGAGTISPASSNPPTGRAFNQTFLWLVTPLVHRVPSGTAVIDPVLMDNTTAQGGVTAGTTPNVIDFVGYGIEYEVPGGLVPLEDVEPINLPESVVIDLGQINTGSYTGSPPDLTLFSTTNRLSQINPQNNNPLNRWVVMMSPSGQVVGSGAEQFAVTLWMRTEDAQVRGNAANVVNGVPRKEVVVGNSGGHIILAIMSQTGLVAAVEPNFVETNADGFYDFPAYYNNVPNAIGTGL